MESLVSNEFWRDRRVFVTGATGLLGSWLTKKLISLQADVVVLIRDWVSRSLFLTDNLAMHCTVIRGDLSETLNLERILAEYEIKTIFHLAAQTIVPIANANPLSTFKANIEGTWNLLEACRHNKGVTQVVMASSDKAYGEVTDLPYREETPLAAIYPYDVSKACADMLGVSYAKTWQVPVTITRCGNFFGGGDLNWNRLVPGTIRQILKQVCPEVRSDGQMLRDYIYIEDAVEAYLLLAEAMAQKPSLIGEAFNFSNNHPLKAIDMVNHILQLMGSSLTPTILNHATGEIKAQYLDASKARALLNWQPQFDVMEGLKRTIAWYRNFADSSKSDRNHGLIF